VPKNGNIGIVLHKTKSAIYVMGLIKTKQTHPQAMQYAQNYYPEGANQQVQWGDWVCLSFTDDSLDFDEAKDKVDYYYLIFAYNEKTGGVRYIASYSMDCGWEEDPYFLELEWK